jgi:hypothetical protein
MRRVTLSGVPVHPDLVHFPVVFWILVPLLDLGNGLDREGPYWRLGWFFAFAGVISALPAIVAGALDAWPCRNVAAAENTLWRHAGLMLSAWTLFALACLLCSPSDPDQAERCRANSSCGSSQHMQERSNDWTRPRSTPTVVLLLKRDFSPFIMRLFA